jgi:hypothetical protein
MKSPLPVGPIWLHPVLLHGNSVVASGELSTSLQGNRQRPGLAKMLEVLQPAS